MAKAPKKEDKKKVAKKEDKKMDKKEDEKKGKNVDVILKGYYLQDKVIRHSKVVVGE